jgi:uncharacterized protein (TIGR00730 family)
MSAITVYCASSDHLDESFHAPAARFGAEVGRRGITLVYGGGSVGLMGEIARAARAAGGRTVGVITQLFVDLERADPECDEMIVVETMRERKRLLMEHADAFAMLPGGIGTYEEFFETLVARQIGEHQKPIGIMNTNGYFDPLIDLLTHGAEHRFIHEPMLDVLAIDESPIAVLERMFPNGESG